MPRPRRRRTLTDEINESVGILSDSLRRRYDLRHVATEYLANGDRLSAESLVRDLRPWARRRVLIHPSAS